MNRSVKTLLTLVLILGPFLGCTENSSIAGIGRESGSPAVDVDERPSDTFKAPKGIDPQVFQDMIEAAFVVPGESQLRSMRVGNFVTGQVNMACGDPVPPLDATDDRLSQDEFPILDLISEKGFTEDDSAAFRDS